MTLRRIPSEQLLVGMYIHAFDGSWFDNPFWSRNFLLRRERDLATVLNSAITTLLIDTSKGADLPLPAQAWVQARAQDTRTHDEKIAAAMQVVNRAREVVRGVFESARLGKPIESGAVASVVEDVVTSIENNRHALLKVLRLKKKDEYTYLHSVAVCALMVNLARQLGIDEQAATELGTAGLLHDVGKVMIPAEVLNKPGKLTDQEYVLAKTHALEGYRLLGEVDNLSATAMDVCQHHHEKIDGTGYPHGLRNGQISRAARMGAICDVYDAVTSNRPYKDAWSPLDTITRMRLWSGHFDPQILSAFMVSIGVFPVGTVVQLRDDRLGVVIEGGGNWNRPKVLAFYSTRQRIFTRSELVVAGDERSDAAIIAEVDPASWGITREKIDRLVKLGSTWV